jgi:phage terminase small subunit
LTKVEVVKETAKLYQVGYLENIIDRQYIPSRVRKDSNVFDTEIAALRWLEKAAQEHVKKTVKHLEESRQIVSDIRMRLEE